MMISPLHRYLSEMLENPFNDVGHRQSGNQVATSPDINSGITVTTVNGHQYSSGDADQEFAIQSIAKVFAYGLALDDLGPREVGKN